MIDFGIFLFNASCLALFVGLILVIIGPARDNKKTQRIGIWALISGAVSLLISFTLCSFG